MLLSSTIVNFHLLRDGSVDMQISSGLSRIRCRIFDTEVTVKAHWPLDKKYQITNHKCKKVRDK